MENVVKNKDKKEEKMIEVEVTFFLSEAGQRDAILRGHAAHSSQAIIGNINAAYLADCNVHKNGKVSFNSLYCDTYKGRTIKNFMFDIYPDTAEQIVEATLFYREGKRKEIEDELAMEATADLERQERRRAQYRDQIITNPRVGIDFTKGSEKIKPEVPEDLCSTVQVALDEYLLKEQAALDEKRKLLAEQETRDGVRKSFLVYWIKESGTENQKERLKAGMLSESEMFKSFKDSMFEPYSHFSRYGKIQPREIDGCGEVVFNVEDAESATAEQWDRMASIKKVFDDMSSGYMDYIDREKSSIILRKHTAENDDNKLVRFGVLVTLFIGSSFSISREFSEG